MIDAGESYFELRGVELIGTVEFVGEQPRMGAPEPRLDGVERLFGERYGAGRQLVYDGRHAWVRLAPDKEVTWDFRKLLHPGERAHRGPRDRRDRCGPASELTEVSVLIDFGGMGS